MNSTYIINNNKKEQLSENIYDKLINYALGAEAIADSEYNPNVDLHYKASQAVDGKRDISAKDMWISTNLRSTHWLKVDLGQSKTITKFVISIIMFLAIELLTLRFKEVVIIKGGKT